MQILSSLKLAHFLDRLSNTPGLSTPAEVHAPDPFWAPKLSRSCDQAILESFAQQRAFYTARNRQETERLEKEKPGYREELRRQRIELGLPAE